MPESHFHLVFGCPDPLVSTAFVPSKVHPANSESFVLESAAQSTLNADEVKPMDVYNTDKASNWDDVQHVKVDISISQANAIDGNAIESVWVCNFSRKIYDPFEIAGNLYHITEVLHLM